MKHPAHPLIVHFPIACWSLSTLGDLLNFFEQISMMKDIAILMLTGCISAVVAMLAGIYELSRIKPVSRVYIMIERHIYAATMTLCFYAVSLFLRWDNGISDRPDIWIMTTSLSGFICLAITGWYGGHLVYKYGVGKISE